MNRIDIVGRDLPGDIGPALLAGTVPLATASSSAPCVSPVRPSERLSTHVTETLRLAGPISMGHLSYLAMTTATLILFGWHSADALAAGGLAIRVAVSTNILAGVLLVVGVAISEAQGGGQGYRVAGLYWNGLYLAAGLSVVSFLWMSVAPSVLALLGQPPDVVADAKGVLDIMRWGEPANLIRLGLMRAVLPALGLASILFALTPISIALYVGLALAMIGGHAGLPVFGWLGVPLAMVIVSWVVALVMIAVVHFGRSRRLLPFGRPPIGAMFSLLGRGVPIGVLQGVDGIFYLAVTLAIGQFGAAALAAHQIVLNFGTVAYALAASCGDAAALRISFRRGAQAFSDARLAGIVAVVMGIGSMGVVAIVVALMPMTFIGIFIDVAAPENAATMAIVLTLVPLSAAFIFTDGFYGTGMGALRGLNDNRFAMVAVVAAYWGVGLPLSYLLAWPAGLGARGVWIGLVCGVAAVGAVLVGRYWVESGAVVRRHALLTSYGERAGRAS
jgi:MATE family multidrug resistance protein